jgi:hypothetical protein
LLDAARYQYYQRECLRFAPSGETLVYDSDHALRRSFAAQHPDYYMDRVGFWYCPKALRYVSDRTTKQVVGRIAFMHERISPAGRRRLVIVSVPTDFALEFYPQALIPASWLHQLTWAGDRHTQSVNFDIANVLQDDPRDISEADSKRVYIASDMSPQLKTRLQVFLGHADPNDSSHFTIDYIVGTERGVIDGWLNDDETVRLQAHGPWALAPRRYQDVSGKEIAPER